MLLIALTEAMPLITFKKIKEALLGKASLI